MPGMLFGRESISKASNQQQEKAWEQKALEHAEMTKMCDYSHVTCRGLQMQEECMSCEI